MLDRDKLQKTLRNLESVDVIDLASLMDMHVDDLLLGIQNEILPEYTTLFKKNAFKIPFFNSEKAKEFFTSQIVDLGFLCQHVIKDFRELEEGKYRILEPVDAKEVDLDEIDIVLVPGIAFDKKGHRIGYGKGYYDSFLRKVNALKIGLCMDFQIVDKIPSNEWDVGMDIVVSEKQVIKV